MLQIILCKKHSFAALRVSGDTDTEKAPTNRPPVKGAHVKQKISCLCFAGFAGRCFERVYLFTWQKQYQQCFLFVNRISKACRFSLLSMLFEAAAGQSRSVACTLYIECCLIFLSVRRLACNRKCRSPLSLSHSACLLPWATPQSVLGTHTLHEPFGLLQTSWASKWLSKTQKKNYSTRIRLIFWTKICFFSIWSNDSLIHRLKWFYWHVISLQISVGINFEYLLEIFIPSWKFDVFFCIWCKNEIFLEQNVSVFSTIILLLSGLLNAAEMNRRRVTARGRKYE